MPCANVLHYAQEIFEGLKAYRTEEGTVQLFRPTENIKRMNNSALRMCIPRSAGGHLSRGAQNARHRR